MRTELTDFRIEYRDMAPIDAKVPCSLISALSAIGEIPTPRAAGDDDRIADALTDDATFSAVFPADELMLSHRYVFLRFHGLFAPAKIAVDGRTVATVSDLHSVTTVEIRNYLTLGEHLLTVTFPGKARDASSVDRPFFDDAGLFRPVECITSDDAAIDRVTAYAEIREEDTFLRVNVGLLGDGRGTRAVATVLSPSGQYFYAGLSDFSGEVNFRHATKWYPAGAGEPACYRLTVTLYRDAEAIDAEELTVGVRALSVSAGEGDGTPIFSADGAPFVPCGTAYLPVSPLLARENAAKIRSRLESAASAGVNLLYVPDGGVYPPDAFYDTCDRLGIVVLQELCADGSSEEARVAACDLIARVAHHPAVVGFCVGGTDTALCELLDARAKAQDPTLFCRMTGNFAPDAFPALPSMSTLRTYLPADGWNYLSDAMISSEEHPGDLTRILNAGYERYPYANGMEKLVYLSGIVQSERAKDMIFAKRKENGVPAPLMFGTLADAKTRTSSALSDAAGKKRAVWYGFRHATSPVVLIPKIEGGLLTLTASNISKSPFRGIATCLLCDSRNCVEKEMRAAVSVPPTASGEILRTDLSDVLKGHEKEFYLAVSLSDGQNTVFSDTALFTLPRSFRFSFPDISYEIKGSGKEFVLTVSSSAFAKYVKLDFQNTEVEWSDNYIDLVKNVPIRIPFSTKSATAAEALTRDFTYMSVYDLLRDEPFSPTRARTEEEPFSALSL